MKTKCILFSMLFSVCAMAQDETPKAVTTQNRTGALPFTTSIGGGVEQVDVGSGNAMINIPILSLPGRGMGFNFGLNYNALFWIIAEREQPGGTYKFWNIERRNNLPYNGLGWEDSRGHLTWTLRSEPCGEINGGDQGTRYIAQRYIYSSPGGQKNVTPVYQELRSGASACGELESEWGVLTVKDEGIEDMLAVSPDIYSTPNIFASDGSRVAVSGGNDIQNPPTCETCRPEADHGWYRDPNGNLKSEFPGGLDTLGRSPLTQTTGTNQITYTFKNVQGVTQSTVVNLRDITIDPQFGISGIAQQTQIRKVIQSIVLPDGKSYSFLYEDNSFGAVTRITLPTGAYISYTWSTLYAGTGSWKTHRYVSSRTVNNGSTIATWNISRTCVDSNCDTIESIVTDPYSHQSKYRFTDGAVTLAEHYSGAVNSNPLRKYEVFYGFTANSARRITAVNTRLEDNKISRIEYSYEPSTNGNVSEVREYDYGTGAPGSLVRRRTKSYWHVGRTAYQQANIVSKVSAEAVWDSAGVKKAETFYEYDNTPLASTSGAAQHDYAAYGSTNTVRGNVTKVKRWKNLPTEEILTTEYGFDDLGNLRSVKSPRAVLGQIGFTTIDYVDNFADSSCPPVNGSAQAFVRRVINAKGHTSNFSYKSCTGQVASKSDPNGQGTTFTYDFLNRPEYTYLPGGAWSLNQYDTNLTWKLKWVHRGTGVDPLKSYEFYDLLGQVTQTKLCENADCAESVMVNTTYDLLNRVKTVSNPRRNANANSDGITTTDYDALGRVTKVTHPDGYFISTVYEGNAATVYDENNKARWSRTDGLGRVDAVGEPEKTSGIITYYTYYTNDILDNLKTVQQRGNADPSFWRNRTFEYNSLSELIYSINPEAGRIDFTYDPNGNLKQKWDQRPSSLITYNYDELDRLISKVYTDTTTQNASYSYDQTTANGLTTQNGIGRRTSMSNGPSNTVAWAYGPTGEVLTERRTIPATTPVTADVAYEYNLDGSIKKLTYPSGRIVLNSYDTAGRLKLVNEQNFGQHNYWWITGNVWFHPDGTPKLQSFGNGLVAESDMDNRQRVRVGTLYGRKILYYKTNIFEPNGNIQQILDDRNANRNQVFLYDKLNRIDSAQSAAPEGHEEAWGLDFEVDAWGNLSQQAVIKGNIPGFSAAVATDNRLVGYGYDLAGNMTSNGAATYNYDKENRMTGTAGWTYTYDADGKRIKKHQGAPGSETDQTFYFYSGSEPVAERTGIGDWSDYVFAAGKRIAKADTFEDGILIYGNNCTSCGAQVSAFDYQNLIDLSNGELVNYVIRPGDRLEFGQYSSSNARGGMVLFFANGSNTAWSLLDQDSQVLNSDQTTSAWHWRRADLSAYAGRVLSGIRYTADSQTLPGDWSMVFRDVVLNSEDGTVRPIYTGQNPVSLTISGTPGSSRQYSIRHLSNVGWHTPTTVTYYHGDHLGSARVTSSQAQTAVWAGTFLPYGQEFRPRFSTNDYKFSGKERDSASGCDNFGARYYCPTMGRFLTADPMPTLDISDPQKLNRYAYARNNPLINLDVGGLCVAPAFGAGQVGICVESYIQADRVGGIGRGDDRTRVANDPNATFRSQTLMTIDLESGDISATTKAGTSELLFGLYPKSGIAKGTISDHTIDSQGNISFTLMVYALNGHAAAGSKRAPQSWIEMQFKFVVKPDGTVHLVAGKTKKYPSISIYSYSSQGIRDIWQQKESGVVNDLDKPMSKINPGKKPGESAIGGELRRACLQGNRAACD